MGAESTTGVSMRLGMDTGSPSCAIKSSNVGSPLNSNDMDDMDEPPRELVELALEAMDTFD